jgi:hypothetical protein
MGHRGAVLAILKPVLNMVDANGLVLAGWGFNYIHNGVNIMLYEGHDKYDQFVTQLQAIKQALRELCDGGARRRRSGGGPGRGCARRPVGIPSPPRGGRLKPRSRARHGTVGG